jgi:hypothetical protein
MGRIDTDWARQQFELARVRVKVGQPVLDLLEHWNDMEFDGTSEEREEILAIFEKLAAGHSLVPEAPDEVWVEAVAGFLRVGDVVRVRHDAFDGEAGVYHNGRRGKVVAIRGNAIFRSTDDRSPFIDGASYPINKLEKRVQ